jgi:hypothetical protein
MVTSMETKKLIGAAAFTVALAGGAAAGALLGVPGSSGAQETTTTADPVPADDEAVHHVRGGPQLDAAAEALGMTTDELQAELESGKTIADVAGERSVDLDTVIDAIVADVTADVREHVTDMVNGELPEPSFGHGRGPGMGRGPGHGFGIAFRAGLDTAAEAIGISEDDLRTALEGGQSVAQVAEANGVDAQTVIDTLVAEATAKIDEAVADGDLPQDRADEIKADLTEHITTFVNREGLPERGERHMEFHSESDGEDAPQP